MELLKGLFPFAVILERLEPADLVFENGSLGLQHEVVSGERHGNSFLKATRMVWNLAKPPRAVKGSGRGGHDPNGQVKDSWTS